MRVFLTGGTGLVGRAVRAALAERARAGRDAAAAGEPDARGLSVRALTRRAAPSDGIEWLRGDLAEPSSWRGRDALAGCEVVLHVAGSMPPDLPGNLAINRDATRALLDEALSAGVRRFVYVSSAAVYGDSEHVLIAEDAPRRGDGPYALSKLAAEDAVLAAARAGGMASVVLRPCMVTGPGDTNLAPALAALASQPVVTLPGHGAARLDLVDARDLAWVLLRTGLEGVGDGAYNVTGGQPRSMRAILEATAASIGATPQWRGVSLEQARREGSAPAELIAVTAFERTYSIDKAARELGYRPAFSSP